MGITPEQFQQLQKRVSRRGGVGTVNRSPSPLMGSAGSPRPRAHEVILGIDPSLRGTGYGVIRWGKPGPLLMAQGTIRAPQRWERSRCLLQTSETLRKIVQEHRPSVCIVEGLFFAQNLQTALILGEARGVCLLAAAEAGLEIYEIATRKVKQAIVGYGAAQKLAVAKMVQRMLRLAEPPAPDAADALALALTFAQENGSYNLKPQRRL